MKKLLVSFAAALLCGTAFANTPVYNASNLDGNQAWGGMIGNDFHVLSNDVWVTQLGVFDHGRDGLTANLQVGLYSFEFDGTSFVNFTQVVGPVTFAAGTTNAGGTQYLFQDIAPVQLQAGQLYSIQALGFDASNLNYNGNLAGNNQGNGNNSTTPVTFDTFGSLLSNREGRWSTDATLGIAGNYFAHSSTFGAGTLSVSAVPEPETYAMMLAGLGALGFMARRRQRK